MQRAVALITLSAVLVLGATGCGGRTSTPGHGILLVGRAKYGKSRIFLWRPGSPARPLGRARYGISSPQWSPDGRSIAWEEADIPAGGAYPESDGISLMRSDGTRAKGLTEDDYYDGPPSWSPDGRQIVYVRAGISGGLGLVVVDVRSGHERTLHPRELCSGTYVCAVVWGKPGIAYETDSGIMLVNPATGRSRLVARGHFYHDLAWSPSGVLAVLESKAIVFLSAAGRVLGELPTPAGTNGYYCPVWSLDGKQILVTGNSVVWVGTVRTKHWQQLTLLIKGNECAASWR